MHDREELEGVRAQGLEPDLLGINNRDIRVARGRRRRRLPHRGAWRVSFRTAGSCSARARSPGPTTRGGRARRARTPCSSARRSCRRPIPARRSTRSSPSAGQVAVTRVKLCGLTSEVDVALCAEAGADALGFVIEYPLPVPWTLDRRRAAALMQRAPPFVTRVAVVGGDAATVLAIAEATEPDAVQLHLDEDEATVAAVKEGLAGTGTRIVKAIRISAGATPPAGGRPRLPPGGSLDAGADAILLDSKTERPSCGNGRARRLVARPRRRRRARAPTRSRRRSHARERGRGDRDGAALCGRRDLGGRGRGSPEGSGAGAGLRCCFAAAARLTGENDGSRFRRCPWNQSRIASAVWRPRATVVSIGLTPGAVGSGEASPSQTPRTSWSSPCGPATEVPGSMPNRHEPSCRA